MNWIAELEWTITTYKRNPKSKSLRRMIPVYRSGKAKFEGKTHKQAIDKATKHVKTLTLQGSTDMDYGIILTRSDQL